MTDVAKQLWETIKVLGLSNDKLALSAIRNALSSSQQRETQEAAEQAIISRFLEQTGQYVTNDASREAAVKHAVTDTDLQYREAMHCLSDVMRAANHALVGMPSSETESKLRAELFRAHVWFMAEVNSDTYMGEPANQPKENDSADDFVNGCPHCGGTGGHWEGCRAPVPELRTTPCNETMAAVYPEFSRGWNACLECVVAELAAKCPYCRPPEPKEASKVEPVADETRINGETPNAHNLLAALIDIHDDAQNNPPESRAYIDSAWADILREARAFIDSTPSPQALGDDTKRLDWLEKHFTHISGICLDSLNCVQHFEVDCEEDTLESGTTRIREAIDAAILAAAGGSEK